MESLDLQIILSPVFFADAMLARMQELRTL
jgi:hypothetical protein